LDEGASRLLQRATDARSLDKTTLIPRLRNSVEKYLLRDDQQASLAAIAEFIDQLQADDLCLTVACEQNDQAAWSDLVERFSVTVRSAARSASSKEEAAEDLAQSIWAELYGLRVREDGKPASKLAYYSGRGSLAGWLRAVVAQLAVDRHRKQSRLVQTEEEADFDRMTHGDDVGDERLISSPALDPELAAANKFTSAEMQEALAQSIKQLSAEDRLLVKLYYFDGLRLREAGAVLGVHEATASRRLTRVHSELRQHVEMVLIEEKGWTRAETEYAFQNVALELQTDLEPLLANEGSS
jgi:RNA polymerase sigma-70 factor (ECF subfamily)